MNISLTTLLTQRWNWSPSIVAAILASVCLYTWFTQSNRTSNKKFGEDEPFVSKKQRAAFYTAIVVLFIALCSPIDYISDHYLFSVHMIQHLLITLVVPPLLLISIPKQWYVLALHDTYIGKIVRFLVSLPAAFLLFNGAIFIWHIPALYDLALRNEGVHILEHMSFIVTALLFWFPLYSPYNFRSKPLSWWVKILYLFFAGMPMTLIGAGLTFLQPLYIPYISAPRVFGISPIADQQLGGLIMWIPVNLVYIGFAGSWFLRWMLDQERIQAEQERSISEAIEVATTTFP